MFAITNQKGATLLGNIGTKNVMRSVALLALIFFSQPGLG